MKEEIEHTVFQKENVLEYSMYRHLAYEEKEPSGKNSANSLFPAIGLTEKETVGCINISRH